MTKGKTTKQELRKRLDSCIHLMDRLDERDERLETFDWIICEAEHSLIDAVNRLSRVYERAEWPESIHCAAALALCLIAAKQVYGARVDTHGERLEKSNREREEYDIQARMLAAMIDAAEDDCNESGGDDGSGG